jgi:hypothetical protein
MMTALPNIQNQQNSPTRSCPQLRVNHSPIQPRSTATRSYFRSLRAAEMAAWDATGGDYARASFVPAFAMASLAQ